MVALIMQLDAAVSFTLGLYLLVYVLEPFGELILLIHGMYPLIKHWFITLCPLKSLLDL